MSEQNFSITIALFDSHLKDEGLQNATETLRSDLQVEEGVQEVEFIPMETVDPNAKGIGGFLLGQLKASVTVKSLKALVQSLGNNLFGRTIEIKAEGNGKKLEIKLSRPEDIDKVLPQIDDFING
ncbi:hypothetical protein [Spirulina sp. 06S082]|uniref:hypothetical protein n=1 Tax=Spirulina sp. 06S082 TaxID=3110248 RepID=UPI002B208A00|nr:hypothetical protein [Spirulina sp. 06S082]MEA5472224.1 hypothetical protein [Spirulina sp. 06S082]